VSMKISERELEDLVAESILTRIPRTTLIRMKAYKLYKEFRKKGKEYWTNMWRDEK